MPLERVVYDSNVIATHADLLFMFGTLRRGSGLFLTFDSKWLLVSGSKSDSEVLYTVMY